MGFGEFLERAIQTDASEFDRALKGTSPVVGRVLRKKTVRRKKRKNRK